jgi:hypothetical protein
MNSSTAPRSGWFRVCLKALVVLILAVAAFFAGAAIAERRTSRAVGEAEGAAEEALRAEKKARRELEVMRAIWRGLPPPPLSEEDLQELKKNGSSDPTLPPLP